MSNKKKSEYIESIKLGITKPALKQDVKTEELKKLRDQGYSYIKISEAIGCRLTPVGVYHRLKK